MTGLFVILFIATGFALFALMIRVEKLEEKERSVRGVMDRVRKLEKE